jgi:glycosyltransferase 2 family protein
VSRTILKAGISLALLAVLFSRQSVFSLLREMVSVDPRALIAAIVLFSASLFVIGLRWSAILEALGHSVGAVTTIPLVFVGQFFSQMLPSGVGGDVARAWLARGRGVRLSAAISSVAVDRISGLISLLIIGTAGLPELYRVDHAQIAFAGISLVLLAGYCGCGLIFALDRLPKGLHRFTAVRALSHIAKDVRATVLRPKVAFQVMGYSFVIQSAIVVVVFILARGLAIQVSMLSCLLVVTLSNLLQALPISIAGWGLREGTFVTGFGLFGMAQSDALALSLVFGLIVLLTSLPGSVIWLVQKPSRAEALTSESDSLGASAWADGQ